MNKMLCCAGLFVGYAVGSMLGGPWTFIAPAVGFGLGLVGDMKLMHGSHGSHGGNEGGEKIMVRDPVCGMTVNEKTAKFKSEHMGKAYYFCSQVCKTTFDKNPMKYMGSGEHSGHSMHSGHSCCQRMNRKTL